MINVYSSADVRDMDQAAIAGGISGLTLMDNAAGALYDALVEGRLRAAACDTFVEEPVSPDNKLLTLRNFSATPHLGGNTEEALQKTGMQVVQDTLAVLRGDFSTAHRVN